MAARLSPAGDWHQPPRLVIMRLSQRILPGAGTMHPKAQIQQDLKDAMKSGDTRRRELLRLLMAAFKQVEVDQRKDLTEVGRDQHPDDRSQKTARGD